jgi:hypothetical protein
MKFRVGRGDEDNNIVKEKKISETSKHKIERETESEVKQHVNKRAG